MKITPSSSAVWMMNFFRSILLKNFNIINNFFFILSWLISAAAAVSVFPDYISTVIPSDQSFESNDYAGIFHFRFYHYGEWIDVCVDDKLPVNESNKLIFCHNSKDKNEMYGPLLEKAYAKLFTCYEFLIAGESIDAIVDFTGGLFERFNLSNIRHNIKENSKKLVNSEPIDKTSMWDLIFSSFFMKSIMATCIKTKNKHVIEEIQKNGLILGKLIYFKY